MSGGIVAAVAAGSLADSLGIVPGDVLLEINGHPLRDVLDVQFYASEEELDLTVRRGNVEAVLQGDRVYGVPLGLDFAAPTFDGLRQCRNRCEFCFVSQMPPGLRPSLYVRDDDYRYSVLYGSFITLTQLTRQDWDRLAEQRLSPLYVSVHATELSLRRSLLGREDIPDILVQLDRLGDLGIEAHTQIVLTPGVNDGKHLDRTLSDLVERYPAVRSIGVVPVGLTRYHRRGCRRYGPDEATAVIAQVESVQQALRDSHGVSVAYLADEWYLLAGHDVPADEAYDGYPQIENGIGLVRQFLEDVRQLRVTGQRPRVASCTLVCGTLIAPVLQTRVRDLASGAGIKMEVVPVQNHLFGETVTVSGLLCGEDVLAALQVRDLGQVVFLPRAMFSEHPIESMDDELDGEMELGTASQVNRLRTLDDLTLGDLTKGLGCPAIAANLLSEVWSRIANAAAPTTGPQPG
jgi:putative radical SAM enzyme (TIGR03279 family)